MRLYGLETLVALDPPASGRCRPATLDDLDVELDLPADRLPPGQRPPHDPLQP
jgi:hypothetical protein